MNLDRFKTSLSALALAAGLAAASPAQAAPWPDRAVRLVVPFSAGGQLDNMTRIFATGLSDHLKQPVIIDNRPGAGGIIGSDMVAKAAPDGYTFLVAGNGAITNKMLRSKMPYEDSDLVPVGLLFESASVIVVNANSKIRSLKDWQQQAGQARHPILFATAGTGSTGHFVAEMLGQALKVPVTVVPYKSGSESSTALMGGQVDAASEAAVSVRNYVSAGRVRALAATADHRSPLLPDTPTTAEQGFGQINITHWGGLYAPKDTPPAIIQAMNQAIADVMANPKVKQQLEDAGYEAIPGSVDKFKAFIAAEDKRLGAIVKSANMKAE
ncbi:tripartite tricarboxylate transporter substrate binding protein [Bordetella hinzii]|uniref:Tripartite tricarboxylate transporter family receptor n=1 Tax=Bordetella hinzii OH87 BAL007II TaxID=1331262 RepID=A0ABR4R5E4_9BORD|nr:tripartite tricarboxylate transporter substrate binding protein [Bordetella hinzii]KCB25364.1 tripartite tricarboxylate transporter family receptor [Bordetella hinzii OH87 BAL007II]KCB44379.1 tripartite tricarboxylate transporter family receptor [Bordetella hinzii 5132]QDJ43254.1 tripartite tricarboxylate transporter substrate binding protein [Bordetella hinzii]QDJ47827.1 tripartite tricarboxylate transporter substrate binding protein [Bordetella hinzii]QWF38708.1 tripartite tricarboxylate 